MAVLTLARSTSRGPCPPRHRLPPRPLDPLPLQRRQRLTSAQRPRRLSSHQRRPPTCERPRGRPSGSALRVQAVIRSREAAMLNCRCPGALSGVSGVVAEDEWREGLRGWRRCTAGRPARCGLVLSRGWLVAVFGRKIHGPSGLAVGRAEPETTTSRRSSPSGCPGQARSRWTSRSPPGRPGTGRTCGSLCWTPSARARRGPDPTVPPRRRPRHQTRPAPPARRRHRARGDHQRLVANHQDTALTYH